MRLFIAIEFPDRVLTGVENVVAQNRTRLPPARWVSTSNLHLTLAFLGELPESRLRALGGAMSSAAASASPFSLQLEGSGCFPPRGKANVAWIGFRPSSELSALQTSLVAALRAGIAYEPERREFTPHLTVARLSPAWPSSAARAWAGAVPGPLGERFRVHALSLVQSRLGPAGPQYTTLHRLPLGGSK